MTEKRVIHITGAAGTGATTLGVALAQKLDYVHLDTDDFYWLPSEPPYQNKRPIEQRLARIHEAIEQAKPKGCVISGSLDGWGDPLISSFDLVVFLTVSVQTRIERLRQREKQRYGAETLAPNGSMHEQHEAFIAWAAAYDAGIMPGRSLPRHEKWLSALPCPLLRLDGSENIDLLLKRIITEINSMKPHMKAESVIDLYNLFEEHGIEVWIDGGWGVDALLGRQTRLHEDLDIALRHSDVPAIRKLLAVRGYRDVPRDDSRDCNFVLGDDHGHHIDIHSFELDTSGINIFGVAYRAEHLTGSGTICGHRVRCIPPDWMVKFHIGYPLDINDFYDVQALCEKFNIEMPEEHKLHWQIFGKNQIRDETERDYSAIHELHRLAFGGEAEAKLVDDLRQSHDAIISLVAERNKQIIGHVLFSKLEAPMKALGLAPVGVHPAFQKQGVGSALIREGLHQAKKKGWMCVFVLGDPIYYGRFGFRVDSAKGYTSPYSGDHFMALSFESIPQSVPKTGQIGYPEPFKLLD